VDWLGSDAFGHVLEPGRVGDCYLGLLLPPLPAGEPEAGRVLVVGPASLLHPHLPQPAGSLVYELLTGHPERQPHELVFLADLAVELRAWPVETWAGLGVDPAAVAPAPSLPAGGAATSRGWSLRACRLRRPGRWRGRR
jgi:hypothetical protein